MNNYEDICNKVNAIISPLFLVGGAVRDVLLNKEPKDYDFTTSLSPDEVENKVRNAGRRVYLIGKKFGTIGFKIDSIFVEVTTFRTEEYKEKNRKPNVEFVKNIEEDLKRRDFTINAMAIECDNYLKLIDMFEGKRHLDDKIITCVGNARQRFKEDPLRMLRACRFASQLNYTIAQDTFETMSEMSYKILEVSKERWVVELDKLLTGSNPSIGLDYLMTSKLLNFMIPELSLQLNYNQNNPNHSKDLWTHTKTVVHNTSNDIIYRWSALLHDIGKPFVRHDNNKGYSNYIKHDLLGKEIVIKIANYLKWSNDRKDQVAELVLNHMNENSPLKNADEGAK